MSSWSELLERGEPQEHVVQLYGADDQPLTRNVARFLEAGLARGDGLVVIATAEHAATIVGQLDAESRASAAMRSGQLIVLDAKATLDRFMAGDEPDEDRFREVVGPVLEEARRRSASGRVRAFGEMVGVLWAEGRRPAAVRLEACWNHLLEGSAVSLFCAYPIDILDAGPPAAGLAAVLDAHSHMYAGPGTVLTPSR